MVWESVPPASRLRLMRQCVEDPNTSSPPFTQIRFFFFFHRSSPRSCYHIRYHCTGITSTAYARGTTTTRRRYLFPLAPTPAAAATACIRRYASKVMFFFFFFLFLF